LHDCCRYKLAPEEWKLLESVRKFLKAFKMVTNHVCAESHPTLAVAVPMYNFLLDKLEDYRDAHPDSSAIKAAADASISKLKLYYSKAGAEIYPVATMLDPRFKADYYRTHGWEQEWVEEALAAIDRVFARYRASPAPRVHEREPIDAADDHDSEDEEKNPMGRLLKRPCLAERDELEE
jgi:hypothetical protein